MISYIFPHLDVSASITIIGNLGKKLRDYGTWYKKGLNMTIIMTIIVVTKEASTMKSTPDLEYISVAETKARLSEKIKNTKTRGRRYAITSHGKPKAVLLNYKDYIALVEEDDPSTRETINLNEWIKKKGERQRVVDSIASLFDESKLTRKGQKEYKNESVEELRKNKK